MEKTEQQLMPPLKENIINYILKFISEREREVRTCDLIEAIMMQFGSELKDKCNDNPFADEMFAESVLHETYRLYGLTYTEKDGKLIGLTEEGYKAASHPKGILEFLENKDCKTKPIMTNKVFIVHGHNEAVKQEVARFVEHLKLEAVILHEQVNRGRTIIEKFEANSSDVNFAIVLLTADDEGKAITESDYQKRARQNVIFEMGYFVGKLSRSNVFMLLDDGVEKPSDMDGIVYTSLKDDWKTMLFKELYDCGYKVDPKDLLNLK